MSHTKKAKIKELRKDSPILKKNIRLPSYLDYKEENGFVDKYKFTRHSGQYKQHEN